MKNILRVLIFISTFSSFAQANPKALTNKLFFHVNAKGTYLNVASQEATRLDLGGFDGSLKSGDVIGIRAVGNYTENSTAPDANPGVTAVFVDGAGNYLAPGPRTTASSIFTVQDIDEDFWVSNTGFVAVGVPEGAVALLMGPNSSSFDDNEDNALDFGVEVSTVTADTFFIEPINLKPGFFIGGTGSLGGNASRDLPEKLAAYPGLTFTYVLEEGPRFGTANMLGGGFFTQRVDYSWSRSFDKDFGKSSIKIRVTSSDQASTVFEIPLSVMPIGIITKDRDPDNGPSSCQVASGKPVNIASGALWHETTDFRLPGRTPDTDLLFSRTYVAASATDAGDLGLNWGHNWETKLKIFGSQEPGAESADVMWIDEFGGPWLFVFENGAYTSPGRFKGKVEKFSDRYELTKTDKTKYTFSLSGQLIEREERHGEKVTLTYANNLLATISANLAGTLTIARDSEGRIATITRSRDNLSYSYSYTSEGRLAAVTDFSGLQYQYSYNSAGLLETIRDPLNRLLRFTYYPNGKAYQQFEPGGGVRSFYYSPDGEETHSTEVLEINGAKTTYFFDDSNHCLKTIDAIGGEVTKTWTQDGFIESRTDELGFTTSYQYDANGNLSAALRPGLPATIYVYDQNFNVVTSIDPAEGANSVFTIDQNNGDVLGVSRTDGATTLSLFYTRDAFGNILSTDNGRAVYSDQRNLDGLLTTVFDTHNPETRTYDARARLATRTFASGRVLAYSYDDYDRVVQVTDSQGPTTQTTYDAMGRVLSRSTTDGQSTQTTSYVWDEQDRLVSETDAAGRVTKYLYEESRVLKSPSMIIDPAGRKTLFKYDVLGRLIEKRDPREGTTKYAYDLRGDLISVTDANGKITEFQYDENRRKIREIRPSIVGSNQTSRTIRYFYDALDRLVLEQHEALSGQQRSISYQYDAFDRLAMKTISGPGVPQENNIFSYENQLDAELLKNANNSVANLSFVPEAAPPFLNSAFTVQAAEGGNPKGLIEDTFTITRDVTGEVANISGLNQGQIYSKSYDAAGRLTAVDAGVLSTVLAYDGFGRKTRIDHSNGVSGVMQYDVLNRITSINWKNGTKSDVEQYLAYDKAGNISDIVRENATYKLTYDETDQLVGSKFKGKAGVPDYNRSFQFDLLGNRILDNKNGVGTYSSDFLLENEANRYLASDAGFGDVVQEISKETNKVKNFTYRGDGKLASFQTGNLSVNYFYDALNRRVAKSVNQSGSQYTQSFTHLDVEDRILLAKAGDGAITKYIDGQNVDEHLGEVKGSQAKAYVTDHLGSVLNTEPAGSAKTFGLFGESNTNVKISSTSSSVMYGFTGREYDAESGLSYHRARNYDANTGNWLSQEPTGIDGPNLYWYAGNNPVRYVDPSGLSLSSKSEGASPISNDRGIQLLIDSYMNESDGNVGNAWSRSIRDREVGNTSGSNPAALAEHYLYAYSSVIENGYAEAGLLVGALIPGYSAVKFAEQTTGCYLVSSPDASPASFREVRWGYKGVFDALQSR